jgi:hypothetical protein
MVAEVRIVPGSGACAYSSDGGATPCEAPECGAGPKADMNACMQLTAEYCMMRPADQGCSLLTLLFLRTTGSVQKIDLHMNVDSQVDAILIDASCECGEDCEDPSMQVLSVSYSIGRVQLEVSSSLARGAKLCASEKGSSEIKSEYTTLLARVDFVSPTATSLYDGHACKAEVCSDPESEACLEFTAEYCAHRPDDEACRLVVLHYTRPVGLDAQISLHVRGGLKSYAAANFVSADCACDDTTCTRNAVQVTAVAVEEGTDFLKLSFVGAVPGKFHVCASPRGGLLPSDFSTLMLM